MKNRIRGILTDATSEELASPLGQELTALAAMHECLPFQDEQVDGTKNAEPGTADCC